MKNIVFLLMVISFLNSCTTVPVSESKNHVLEIKDTEESIIADDSLKSDTPEKINNPEVNYLTTELPTPIEYPGHVGIEVLDVDSIVSRKYSEITFTVKVTNLTNITIETIAFTADISASENSSFKVIDSIRTQKVSIPPGNSSIHEIYLTPRLRSKNNQMFAYFDSKLIDYTHGLSLIGNVYWKETDGKFLGFQMPAVKLKVVPDGAKAVVGHENIIQAVISGNSDLVESRLLAGDNVNTFDSMRTSILVYSILQNNLDIANVLINAGADLNLYNVRNEGALSASLRVGDIAFINKIIDLGGEYTDSEGFSGFQWAMLNNQPDLAKQLLDVGATPESRGFFIIDDRKQIMTLLQWATLQNDRPLIQTLIELGASPSKSMETGGGKLADATPLYIAAEKGNVGLVEYYLSIGANPNTVDNYSITPLMAAAHFGDLESVRLLVESGADINYLRSKSASGAMSLFSEEPRKGLLLRDFIFFGATSFSYSFNALTIAAYLGHADIVEYLISQGADINQVYNWGDKEYTVLDVAQKLNQNRVVEILKKAGVKSLLVE